MYNEIIPGNWATQYIDAYWVQFNKQSERVNVTILPDGCTDIVLSFNNKCEKMVVGCMTKPNEVYIEPFGLMFGIRFKTGCAAPFLNIPMKELTDKKYSLMEIRDFDINIITPSTILYKRNLIPDMLERNLKKIFLEKKFDKTVCLTVNLIEQYQGLKSIDDIANNVGVSKRHLERKFLDFVGMSPKLYSRIVRFRYTNKMLKTKKMILLFL
ncbi:MAG: hypothetical protein HZC10_03600 [Nitrospirae bacterium]|nr:hypothetical protein [Nitrospirota bacterium]